MELRTHPCYNIEEVEQILKEEYFEEFEKIEISPLHGYDDQNWKIKMHSGNQTILYVLKISFKETEKGKIKNDKKKNKIIKKKTNFRFS